MMGNLIKLPLVPPTPTLKDPYIQLTWLCEQYVRRFTSEASKNNIRATVRAYLKLLSNCNGYDKRLEEDPRFFLNIHCDELVLYLAGIHWKQQKYSIHTLSHRFQGLDSLFSYGAELGLTAAKQFIRIQLPPIKRSTLIRAAYEDGELEFIWKTFNPIFAKLKQISYGYRKTGVGVDPETWAIQKKKSRKKAVITEKMPRAWWGNWENMVWYFENKMNCQPLPFSKDRHEHMRFYEAAAQFHGGIKAVHDRLGVVAAIDIGFIASLAMKLCWETGLNTEVLLNLKRDCFQPSHPLTGQPYLKYYKARSTGEKDLHLNLLNKENSVEVHLSQNQVSIIKRTVEMILKLTEPLVSKAKPEYKDLLFLYQARSSFKGEPYGRVLPLTAKTVNGWSRSFLRPLKKSGDPNVPQIMNLGRFRPTKILQLVREGKDFFEIQIIAGHASIKTTLGYIDSLKINPIARREITKVLKKIHTNINEFKKNPKPYSKKNNLKEKEKDFIYKGIFCDCKNIFDPPKPVRQLPNYKPGQACTYFNMCLLCPNVLITKKHLPLLVTYYREINSGLLNSLGNAPNSIHYQKTKAVIEGILLEYTDEEVKWATEIAECNEFYTEPLTYQPIKDEN